jgi:hypothetical protein
MEPILNFLEQYWGYTLVGGVTIGTVVSGIYLQLKSLGVFKSTNKTVNAVTSQLDLAITKYQQSEAEKTELAKQNAYLEKVIATTFKSISYLSLASKLPTEDKIELQSDFSKLAEEAKSSGLTIVKNVSAELKETTKGVLIETAPVIGNIIVKAVDEGKSLLDKYTSKEGV